VAAAAAVVAVNEQQTVTFTGTPTGGTFRMGYLGAWTAPLVYNISNTNLQAALVALATVGAGGATVAGSAGGPYTITAAAGLAGADIPLFDVDSDLLSTGGIEEIDVATTRAGVSLVAEVTAVSEVQTITMSAKSGTFRVGYKGQWTTELAYNVAAADLQTALRALSTVGAGNLTVTGTAGSSYVLTAASALAGTVMDMFDLDLSGLASYSGDFIAGSFVQPTDGSETILTMVGQEDGKKVTDRFGTNATVSLAEVPVGGMIDTAYIVNYPTDTSLQAWVKAALRAAGGMYVFRDDWVA
jgi:hypothetical protein